LIPYDLTLPEKPKPRPSHIVAAVAATADPRGKPEASDFLRDIPEDDIHFDTRLTPPDEEPELLKKKRRRPATPSLDENGNPKKISRRQPTEE
jgi:hypothetical protein